MAYNPNAPVFADRYRFEPVSHDWDRGRSGYTHLVYDLKEERLGVIKRAETKSKQADGLSNEIKALRALKGLGVPEVYAAGHVTYDSKNYDYMVIEYIDAIRVEKSLVSLSVVERAIIITKLFGLLSQAHQKGIVNSDVDLKHLFWYRNKKQLVVIDWGNARLDVDPRNKMEFAYDLARAAEIIFSLVTRQGHAPATGSIALPNDSELISGLRLLPVEFRNLCKWAPRTPSDGAQAPFTAQELFEVSNKWLDAVGRSKRYRPNKWSWLIGIPFLVIISIALSGIFWRITTILPTPTAVVAETSSPLPITDTPKSTEIVLPTIVTPTETVTATSAPVVTPVSSSIVTFDKHLKIINCWINEAISPSNLLPIPQDGFYRRTDANWAFNVGLNHSEEDIIQVDFSQCLGGRQVQALALNIIVYRLESERVAFEPAKEKEFGFFLEDQEGHRRDYTLWIDKNKVLNLRVREDNNIIYDEEIDQIVNSDNLASNPGIFPSYKFSIQIFFQIDDQGQGLDILYLPKGKPAEGEDINPMQMTRMDSAMFKTLGAIQKIGLVGRGGKTETLIWPLIFSGQ